MKPGDKVRAKGETWTLDKIFPSGVLMLKRQSDHERHVLLANARDVRPLSPEDE